MCRKLKQQVKEQKDEVDKICVISLNKTIITWTYELHRDLLTAVTNATYSTYVYTNDLLGRCTSKNGEPYGYNVRDELISANDTSYAYDDIGNRTIAEGKTYTANNLNQYIAIDDFTPQYDADGNQTLIKTETGIWSVVYNAENRPVRWTQGATVITMVFDRLGRRVEMRTQSADSDLLQRFVYDNYLCIQQLRGADNALFHSYVWDPTEPIATRPLIFRPASGVLSYYFHDGNKNVSDLVDIQGSVVHYDYTPFGTPTASAPSENPFGFSSEVYDTTIGLVYYNYRHYSPANGRWLRRDEISEVRSVTLCGNSPLSYYDWIGLKRQFVITRSDIKYETFILSQEDLKEAVSAFNPTVCPVAASSFLLEFKGGEPEYDSRCKTCEIDVWSLNVSIYIFLLKPGMYENFKTNQYGNIDVYLSEAFMQQAKAHEQRHVDVYTAAISSQDFSVDTKFNVNSEEECNDWEGMLRRKFANDINNKSLSLHNAIDQESYTITKGVIPYPWFWGYKFEMGK